MNRNIYQLNMNPNQIIIQRQLFENNYVHYGSNTPQMISCKFPLHIYAIDVSTQPKTLMKASFFIKFVNMFD